MASREMIDVLQRLRELDEKNPNLHTDALENAEKLNPPVEEAKAKPDYIDLDKDGNKKEPMKKAAKDAKKKKMDEAITISADSPEDLPVLQQIMKLAGMSPVTPDMMPDGDNVPVMKAEPGCGTPTFDNTPDGDYEARLAKLAGIESEQVEDEETDEGYANSMGNEKDEPTYKGYDPDYGDHTEDGRPKVRYVPSRYGDNPLESIENNLKSEYEKFKK